MAGWEERAAAAAARYEDGAARLPDDADERQRQLTRMGNAAWAAGVSLLMAGNDHEAGAWLARSAERYRESWPLAPLESWGRPLGAMKARLLARDLERARAEARWAIDAGAEASESPIGRYAATLARLVLGDDEDARLLASTLQSRGDFPRAVADALVAVASGSQDEYAKAMSELLADFEGRDAYLEDVPVADTVLVLQELAAARGLKVSLFSPLLPG